MRIENSVKEIGYLTPDSIPGERLCRSFSIPNDAAWLGAFMGAIQPLLTETAWREFGALTPAECADQWQEIFFSFETDCPETSDTVDTPYWDDAGDVDDEMSNEEQMWYGQVADAATAPTELTFIENAFVWAFTGLIAVSLGGVAGLAPALAFRTIASRFVLAYKNDASVETVVRFFVDGVKIYEGVDTGDGSITEVTVISPESEEGHMIYATAEAAA